MGSSDRGENPEATVKSLDFSSNGKCLATFESLEDTHFDNKQIIIENLKIWEKETSDSEYVLKQFVHSPCALVGAKSHIKFINDDKFLFASGQKVVVWARIQYENEQKRNVTRWQIIHEFAYQNLPVT